MALSFFEAFISLFSNRKPVCPDVPLEQRIAHDVTHGYDRYN